MILLEKRESDLNFEMEYWASVREFLKTKKCPFCSGNNLDLDVDKGGNHFICLDCQKLVEFENPDVDLSAISDQFSWDE